MAQPKDFLFYLRAKNGVNYDYYSIVGTTFTTTTSATPINPLKYSPRDWGNIQLTLSRNFTSKGVFRNISETFKFVKDGATILRKKHFEGGVNAKVDLLIRKFNRSGAVYDYEDYFIGSVDFLFASNQLTSFSVNITEAGFLSKYETRKSTKYKIPITDNVNAKWVYFDGINLQFLQKWVTPSGEVIPSTGGKNVPTFSPLTGEGTNLYWFIYQQDLTGSSYNLISNTDSSPKICNITYDYNLSVFIPSSTPTGANLELYYQIFNTTTGANVSQVLAFASPTTQAPNTSQSYVGSVLNTITIPVGCSLVAELRMRVSPSVLLFPSAFVATQVNSSLLMTSDQLTKAGYIPTLSRLYVFTELVKLIGDNTTTGVSNFLSGAESRDKFMFSGDSARNLPKAHLYVSMDDFFETIEAQHGASLYYEQSTDQFILNDIPFAFDNTQIANIGEVGKLDVKPLTSELFGKLLIGQQDYTYDEVNGKDEFNTEIEWLSPLEGVKESKSYLSTSRHDVYGIEQIRLNLSEKKVTDAESDNDIFEVHADISTIYNPIPAPFQGAGNDYYKLYRDNTLIIDNIYSPDTMYNIYFSPKRCLLRRGSWYRSLLFGNDTQYIKFIRSKKSNELNLYMKTDDGVNVIWESEDVLISTLSSPIFKPFMLDIETYTTENLMVLLASNPFGYLTFTFNGGTYQGFVMDLTRQAQTKEKTKLTLLATPACDVTQLIN